MEKKSFGEYLQKVNLEIERNQNNLEKKFGLNSMPKEIVNDVIKLPLKIAGEIYKTIDYLAGNIVKYPLAITNYLLQRN